MTQKELVAKYFVNERVPAGKVKLIDENGTMLGEVDRDFALSRARDAGLDLIMVSQAGTLPICKIMDWGKFKYDLEKKAQKAKKNQVKIVVKEIKFSPTTSEHDYSYRKDHIIEFLTKGYHVKATIFYKGRTILHQEKGYEMLDKLVTEIGEYADVDGKPELKGRVLTVLLIPKKGVKK